MQKPPTLTATYYRSPYFETYVRAVRPDATWLLERIDWVGELGQLNLTKIGMDSVRYPGAYPTSAHDDLAWFLAEFSWLIELRR